jgi:diguanylate cyclase (GGDEF)-like protein
MVASRLHAIGGAGQAFRFGGEEFAVLFPGLTADAAQPHLERLRATVEESSFAIRHWPRPTRKPARRKARKKSPPQVAVTISIGFAEGNGKAPPDEVIKAADQALYRAKENGRNRIEEAS